MLLSFHNITFKYESALNPLFESISVSFPRGWTGIVGANGTGKTTLLRLASGELQPTKGQIIKPGKVIYCPQRTDYPPELLEEMLQSDDGDACVLKGKLGLESDWLDRWNTLSHGEQKRAQIAVALWQEPDVLAVDEPTNHIDADARELLSSALKSFKGVGLLVSHDRDLLDSLCSQCLIINPPDAVMRPGGYTQASSQAALEDETIRQEYESVKHEAQRIHKEAVRRREEASRADKQRSKRKLDRKDSDGRGKLDLVKLSGADGKAGRLARQIEGRVQQTEEKLSGFNIKRKYETSFWLPNSCSPKPLLFSTPGGSLQLGDERRLLYPELTMARDDRIAVTGPNGAGKSTLIRHILSYLTMPEDKIIYLPQEIDIETSRQVMSEVNSLPREHLGHIMTIVSCLGSRPERLVGNTDISPGEIRKVMLALGISKSPYLVIMDEPTNHLDLPAIESLEKALGSCPCGLLLVSHDMRFLSQLCRTRWRLHPLNDGVDTQLSVEGMEPPVSLPVDTAHTGEAQ